MSNNASYEIVPFADSSFPIKVAFNRVEAQPETEPVRNDLFVHWHEHLEIHWFKQGGARVLSGNEWITTEDNDVVVINPSDLHTVLPGSHRSSYWYLIISPQMLGSDGHDIYGLFWKSLTGEKWRISPVVRRDPAVTTCLARIVEEYEAAAPGYELAIRGELCHLMAQLYRAHRQQLPVSAHKRQDQHLKTALRLIGERYDQPLSPQMLAEACGLNLSYFCRLFRQSTGMTAAAYINAYRLSKASELLTSTDLSVTNIAVRVGFEDVAYFSRCFRRQHGISPLQYRRQSNNH